MIRTWGTLSALILGNFILGETLKTNDIIGVLLIFSGLLIIDGRLLEFIPARIKRG